jgi:hypothetical protein
MEELTEKLYTKLLSLSESIWEGKVKKPHIDEWLSNFKEDEPNVPSERLHVLYLLQQFMYFGNRQIRELIKALYRDLYKYPIVEKIRRDNRDTNDVQFIFRAFCEELQKTRFLGMGNPSESGHYLLYFFRQENKLPKSLFIHSHQVFNRYGATAIDLRSPEVNRYVFIDDMCGSGTQASEYSEQILEDLKRLNPKAETAYYTLFSTTVGLSEVRDNTHFDRVECIFELDDSFKCFSAESRYFKPKDVRIDPQFALDICKKYGEKLLPDHPLGYKDGQLLLGLHHNTPDNSLPIFWYDEPDVLPWIPIFRRYTKYYG